MSTSFLSDNCKKYSDVASIAVSGYSSVKGVNDERCRVRIPTITSCQRSNMETPDEVTQHMLLEESRKALKANGCESLPEKDEDLVMDYRIVQYSNDNREFSAEELIANGNVGNCSKVGNDPNDVTMTATARCHLNGPMTRLSDNKVVRSSQMSIYAQLGACDMTHEAEPQMMEDLKRVAAKNLETSRGYRIHNMSDMECNFDFLPRFG